MSANSRKSIFWGEFWRHNGSENSICC